MRTSVLLAFFLMTTALSAQELITNGGFENGSAGWSASGNFYIGNLSNPRSGSWYAYLSNPNGTAGNNLYGTLRQTFNIPNNITSASLRFYYSITSTDTGSSDFLTVWFEGTGTQHTFSNQNVTSGYQSYTFDLTQYAGQTLTVQFLGTTNSTNPTVFRIDDVSATYVSAPTPPNAPTNLQAAGNGFQILLGWTDNANNETSFEVERKPLGGVFVAWTTLGANVTATSDTQAYGSTTCYRVRARNGGGPSGYTSEACATSLEPPALLQPPDGSTSSGTNVTMTWQSSLGANQYRVNVGTSCGGTQYLATDTSQTSYTLNVNPGTYVWQVRAANVTYPGLSQPSNCRTFSIATNSPVASFTYAPQNPEVNQSVQFTDTSSGSPSTWSWSFGDGGSASVQHPAHAYTASGTYTVQLTVTSAGGTNSTTKSVTVTTPASAPLAEFSHTPGSPVAGQQVSFTDTSTNNPTSWSWDFGGTGTSTNQHPTHTFASAGTYAVKLTAANIAGSSIKTRNVTVQASPPGLTAGFTFTPSAPLMNQVVSFTDTSTGSPASWEWDLDGNNTIDSTAQNPTRTYTSAGTYSVKLTVRNSSGSASTTKSVPVQPGTQKPIASFNYSPGIPSAGQLLSFTDTSTNGPTSWFWTFGNGQTSTSQHPSVTYSTAGTYAVSLTVTNEAGSDTTTKTVTVASTPDALVPSFTWIPNNPNVGQRVDFTDTTTGNPTGWSWDFSDGNTSNERHPSHSFGAGGSYNVRLTATNTAGSAGITRTVTVASACSACIEIRGHITVPGQIAVRGNDTTAMRVIFRASNGTTHVAAIGSEGNYELASLPPGRYEIEVVLSSQHLRQPAVARRSSDINQSSTIDIAFPRPIILVHGLRSGPETWDEWLGDLGSYMVITPDYGNELGVGDVTTKLYRELDRRFYALFTATPEYDVVAHSMGGVVSRYLQQQYANTPIANGMHSLVTLGSPHLGTNCFLGEGVDLGRGDRAADDATRLLQRTRVAAIAGTNPNLVMFPGGLDLFVTACTGDCQPHDGLVPVDSALRMPVGLGKPPRFVDGFVVPYNHFELASGKTIWLLKEHILPFFDGAPFRSDCGLAMCGASCVGGSGLTSAGTCTVNDGQIRTGVRVAWTRDPFVGLAFVATAPASCRDLIPAVGVEAGFNIYRSLTPITDLASAERIAFVNRETYSYFDPTGTPRHYYVITIASTTGAEPRSATIKVIGKQRSARR